MGLLSLSHSPPVVNRGSLGPDSQALLNILPVKKRVGDSLENDPLTPADNIHHKHLDALKLADIYMTINRGPNGGPDLQPKYRRRNRRHLCGSSKGGRETIRCRIKRSSGDGLGL